MLCSYNSLCIIMCVVAMCVIAMCVIAMCVIAMSPGLYCDDVMYVAML